MLGQHDAHVRTVEATLGVRIGVTGTSLRISGAHAEQALAGKVIGEIYDLLKHGYPIYPSDVEYAIRIIRGDRNAELKDIFLDTISHARRHCRRACRRDRTRETVRV